MQDMINTKAISWTTCPIPPTCLTLQETPPHQQQLHIWIQTQSNKMPFHKLPIMFIFGYRIRKTSFLHPISFSQKVFKTRKQKSFSKIKPRKMKLKKNAPKHINYRKSCALQPDWHRGNADIPLQKRTYILWQN